MFEYYIMHTHTNKIYGKYKTREQAESELVMFKRANAHALLESGFIIAPLYMDKELEKAG